MTENIPVGNKHRIDHGGSRGGNGRSLSLLQAETQAKLLLCNEDGDAEHPDPQYYEKARVDNHSETVPKSLTFSPSATDPQSLIRLLCPDSPNGRENTLIALLTQAETQLRATKDEFSCEIEALSERIAALESECCFKSKEIACLTGKLTDAYEEKEELITELQSLDDFAKQLEHELHTLRREVHRKERQLSELQSEVFLEEPMVTEKELTDMKRRLSEFVGKHSESDRKQSQEREILEEELSHLQATNAKLRTLCSQSENELKTMKEKTGVLNSCLEEWKSRAEILAEQVKTTREQVRMETTEHLVQLTTEKLALKAQVEELTLELEHHAPPGPEFSLMDELRQVSEDQGNDRMSGASLPSELPFPSVSVPSSAELLQLRSELDALRVVFCTEIARLTSELAFAQAQAVAAKVNYAEVMTESEALRQRVRSALKSLPVKTQRLVGAQLGPVA